MRAMIRIGWHEWRQVLEATWTEPVALFYLPSMGPSSFTTYDVPEQFVQGDGHYSINVMDAFVGSSPECSRKQ